ncbi:MAG: Gfo/Idh/MocA family oxidoreductase [Gammaproteobacteria bacterium]|nr:Gfo/Idh/MocA family oxidoreductase [Gammaproteobacteria bacterium]
MDYTSAPLFFRIRKALRYVGLYGIRRTLVKARGQYHMRRTYQDLPPNNVRQSATAHVGLIGCGNYGFSVIGYYLNKNYGGAIRGCMDVDINKAASLFQEFKACYYTTDADQIINDPNITLVFIASNHASHAEYAIKALAAGKDVHIEKPHVVTSEQLTRLCAAQEAARKAGKGRIVSIGFNRPGSPFGKRMREQLWREEGELMQNWFIAGHEIAPDHWYFRDEEGGRVLGNLCHWTDLTYQMMPPERRFPIRIIPARSAKSDCDIAVSYVFGDGSIAAITFSAKGHTFEGVKERFAAHRGNTLIAMDDFQRLVMDVGADKQTWSPRSRDHGHEASIRCSYNTAADPAARGLETAYVWEAGQLFLRTKEALESSQPVSLNAWSPTA